MTILLFISEEVILEGASQVLTSTLPTSLHNIVYFDVSTLSPSRVMIAAIICRLIGLVPRHEFLGRVALHVLCVLLAHSYQILHFQASCNAHHLVAGHRVVESFIHVGNCRRLKMHFVASVCRVVLLASFVVARQARWVSSFIAVAAGCLVHEIIAEARVLLMTCWQCKWLLMIV